MSDTCAILGSGGREQALAWKIAQSEKVDKVYIIPGNNYDYIPKVYNHELDLSDREALIQFLKKIKCQLVIIGPEALLAEGIVDELEAKGFNVLGPNKEASFLESSKIFSKKIMQKYNIPTANFSTISSLGESETVLSEWDPKKGYVIKADGLASGKGVFICQNKEEAKSACFDLLENPECKIKSQNILLEETLQGKEYSFFALCDGKDYVKLGFACDYKRVFDENKGPNTGGMGGYYPMEELSENEIEEIYNTSIQKVLNGLASEGINFKGFLFAGIMKEKDQFKVLEYNVRMGDPETQILMPLLDVDFYTYCLKTAQGKLNELQHIKIPTKTCVHVVMTSKNYPTIDNTSMLIDQKINLPKREDSILFTSGLTLQNGQIINKGGRVLGISAIANNKKEARELAYKSIKNITFKGAHYRTDIASN